MSAISMPGILRIIWLDFSENIAEKTFKIGMKLLIIYQYILEKVNW